MRLPRRFLFTCAFAFTFLGSLGAEAVPRVWPVPRKASWKAGELLLRPGTPVIGEPALAGEAAFLVRALREEFGFRAAASRRDDIKTPSIEIRLLKGGAVKDPEGHLLRVDADGVRIEGVTARGAFWGIQTLLQITAPDAYGNAHIPYVEIEDWPYKPLRGVHIWLPARDQMDFFERSVRRFMARYKFNTAILQSSAGMRLERHPEINAAWTGLTSYFRYYALGRPAGPNNRHQDGIHLELAGGRWLEKAEVARLVRTLRECHIEVIPEIQSLSHSYYLAVPHRELAEIVDAKFPDSYCPSNPDVYRVLFDVIDEYVDLIKPARIHIGHDEWRSARYCPRCRDKDAGQLFANDVIRIHDYLKSKGIQTHMWADHLLKTHNGSARESAVAGGTRQILHQTYHAAAALPKDIVMYNWYPVERGETAEDELPPQGFQWIYGNFLSPGAPTDAPPMFAGPAGEDLKSWPRRSSKAGCLGGETSWWRKVSEEDFARSLFYPFFLYGANLLWATHYPERDAFNQYLWGELPALRDRLHPERYPSARPGPKEFWFAEVAGKGQALPGLPPGTRVDGGYAPFVAGLPIAGSGSVRVERKADSLVFVHAYNGTVEMENHPVKPSGPVATYRIRYGSGALLEVPVQFGLHVGPLSVRYGESKKSFIYFAPALWRGEAAVLYGFEWINPSPRDPVVSVELVGGAPPERLVLVGVTGITGGV